MAIENRVESLEGDAEIIKKSEDRDKTIIRTSVIGILANVLLAGFKAVIGVITGSIAITLDAVNNISDAASSVITIVGTKLAGKAPDKKHPFGHGRIEYLSAMLISILVLYAGLTSLWESIKKILDPVTPDYSTASLVIIAVAVVVKIVLGRYVKKTGERVNSDSLVNSGQDAMLDSVISASTLAAAAVFLLSGYRIEAWLGAVISLIIIKSGIDMLRETLSKILGESADAELVRNIKKTILEHEEVSGVYDLVLNNYGPDRHNGSVHIEIPDTMSMDDLDELIREISLEVYRKHNIALTAVGIYAMNTKDPEVAEMRQNIRKIVMEVPHVVQMHGFHLNKEKKIIRMDLVISFDSEDRSRTFQEALEKVRSEYPDYTLQVAMDADFTE